MHSFQLDDKKSPVQGQIDKEMAFEALDKGKAEHEVCFVKIYIGHYG